MHIWMMMSVWSGQTAVDINQLQQQHTLNTRSVSKPSHQIISMLVFCYRVPMLMRCYAQQLVAVWKFIAIHQIYASNLVSGPRRISYLASLLRLSHFSRNISWQHKTVKESVQMPAFDLLPVSCFSAQKLECLRHSIHLFIIVVRCAFIEFRLRFVVRHCCWALCVLRLHGYSGRVEKKNRISTYRVWQLTVICIRHWHR